MTHPTAIVYGPQGCGKSTHAHEIAHRLRIPRSNIIDDAKITRSRQIKPGFLHLTHIPPFGLALPKGCIVKPYSDFGFPDLRPDAGEAVPVYRGGQISAGPAVIMETPAETRARLNPNRIDHAIGATRDRISRAVAAAPQTFAPLPPPSAEEIDRFHIAGEILSERNRQITGEGYTIAHDDGHVHGELAQCAAAYASLGARQWADAAQCWPWDEPMNTAHMPREALVIAGALILAEIERLDRAQTASGCTCMEVIGEDPACKHHGRDTEWAKANPENGA